MNHHHAFKVGATKGAGEILGNPNLILHDWSAAPPTVGDSWLRAKMKFLNFLKSYSILHDSLFNIVQ